MRALYFRMSDIIYIIHLVVSSIFTVITFLSMIQADNGYQHLLQEPVPGRLA